jgi:hypothetical protein
MSCPFAGLYPNPDGTWMSRLGGSAASFPTMAEALAWLAARAAEADAAAHRDQAARARQAQPQGPIDSPAIDLSGNKDGTYTARVRSSPRTYTGTQHECWAWLRGELGYSDDYLAYLSLPYHLD